MEKVLQTTKKLRFFDIAANLSDSQFKGIYYEKEHHQNDIDNVINRALNIGCDRLLIVGGYYDDCVESHQIAQKSDNFSCTVGVHPCRVAEVEKEGKADEYFLKLDSLIGQFGKKCVAIGECGLDYDRTEYQNPKEMQIKHFLPHFNLAQKYKLPMYLHNRNTGNDFFNIVKENRNKFKKGVVHSFTGTIEEAKAILDLDLYIGIKIKTKTLLGINGCSIKTQENIDVVKQIPLDKILIETDSPYCEIRNTHVSSKLIKTKFQSVKKEKYSNQVDKVVKGRNEPCQIIQLCEVLSQLFNQSEEVLSEIFYKNSVQLFE